MMGPMDAPLTDDWQLTDFSDPTVTEGVEVSISNDGTKCIVIYPWHYTLHDVQPALEVAKCAGFAVITEYGNLYPYTVAGADTDDSDFIILEVQ